jgi:putative oxidoreductase
MAKFMAPFNAHLYALMRIVVGFTFMCHGAQKLFGIPSAAPEGIPPFVLYVGGSIELIGGGLVMIGLMSRWAAFLCSGMMAAAYWMAHGLKAPLPISNGGELAAVYCFVFLFISAQGAGIWSVEGSRSGAGA